jgi:low temperature requirement protein LtrA
MFRFLTIHTVPPEEEGSTWLQLFFDLVYVAILVELGNRLAHDMNIEGLITFVLLLVPIWWSWLEFIEFGQRYPIDDIGQRILTVVYMAAMLVMAFEIHNLTATTLTLFIATYGLSKFVLAGMYARIWVYNRAYRHLTSTRAMTFVVTGIIWIAIAFLAPAKIWLWVFAVVLGALMPLFIRLLHGFTNRSELSRPPIKYHFTLHRFGELTIIVLGEFFIKLVLNSSGRELTAINYLIGIGLLAISVSLWWLYFDHLEHANLAQSTTRIRFWTYSHFPFLAAITAYGVVGNEIFAALPRLPLEDNKRLLFTFALATALLAFAVIEWASKEKNEPLSRSPQPRIRIGGAAALVMIGLSGESLNVGWLVTLVAAVLLAQVGADVYQRLQRPALDMAQNAVASLSGEQH